MIDIPRRSTDAAPRRTSSGRHCLAHPWRGLGGWRCWMLGLLLWMGLAGLAGASFLERKDDSAFGPLRDWEEPGMLAALQDKAGDTRMAALRRLTLRPTKNAELIRLAGGFLDNPESASWASLALKRLGTEAIQKFASKIVVLLNAEDKHTRFQAANALDSIGVKGQAYAALVKSIIEKDKPINLSSFNTPDNSAYWLEVATKLSVLEIKAILKISADSVQTLGTTGRQSQALAEKVSYLLDDPDPVVCSKAMSALGNMGENALAYVTKLTKLLNDQRPEVRINAVKTLIQLGRAEKISKNQLEELISSEDINKTLNSIDHKIISTNQQALIIKLVELLDNYINAVRQKTEFWIDAIGEAASPYAKQLANGLLSKDSNTQWSAARILVKIGSPGRLFLAQHAALIAGWLDASDPGDRVAAVNMLGELGVAARPYLPRLRTLLDQCQFNCEDIVTALCNIGADLQDFSPQIADALKETDFPYNNKLRIAIYRLGKISQPEILLSLLALAHEYPENKSEYRVDAYLLFGHDQKMLEATAWLGNRQKSEYPNIAELDKAAKHQAIEALRLALNKYPGKADFSKVAAEAAAHISRLVTNETWTLQDAPWLEDLKQQMHASQPDFAPAVDIALEHIRLWQILRVLIIGLMIQALLWLVLIALYPWSSLIQGLVFRQAWFRRYVGLGYIGPLLALPWLRRHLFRPFRPELLPPGILVNFNEERYYDASLVLPRNYPGTKPQALLALVQPLNGQHIIEGASGLGKTTLLRYLALRSRRPTVFLRAVDCRDGVVAAIQRRLQNSIHDAAYLRTLIQAGALDILLDGLNEAPPDTRARLTQFFQDSFRGYFVLTTQPLAGELSMRVRVWELQALAPDALEAFLLKQWPGVKSMARLAEADYQTKLRRLLAELRQQAGLGDEVAAERLRMLCNPMECVFAAELLAQGISPEPGRVLAQIFRLAEQAFRRVENRDFPRDAFAERVYAWRKSGVAYIDVQGFEREARCLVERQLMRELTERLAQENGQRDETRWQFRHDKVMDFFLVPAFRGEHAARRYQECGEARFSGVYDLLAEMLPLEEADELRQFLVERAAESADNTLMNRYTRLFRAREKRPESQAERQFMDARTWLHEAAVMLGSASFAPARRDSLPEAVQRSIRTAERDLRECLSIWQDADDSRRAETESLLENLENGVLTVAALPPAAAQSEMQAGEAEPPQRFDVFLSHNSKDKPAVRELADALRNRGLRVWLDESELVPGRTWQDAIEEVIKTVGSAAVLVGADGLGPWEIPEMRGCLSECIDRKLPVIPVLLPGAPANVKPALPLFLRTFTWVDLRAGLSQADLDYLVWGITGKKPLK